MASPFAQDLIALLPRLRRFARSLTGGPEEVDDLVQAACERALVSQQQWQAGTRLDAWMFCIIRNLWVDAVRKRKREGESDSLDVLADAPGEDGRRTMEARLTADDVQTGIAKLPDDQRQVLLLVCVDERSYSEAGELLEIPIGTVMSRLARARRNLAASLGLAVNGRTAVDAS